MTLRYLARFTDATETQEVVFPRFWAEQEEEQDLLSKTMPLSGGNYEYDLMGAGPLVKGNAIIRLRFWVIGSGGDPAADADTQIEDIRDTCYAIGRGKLWQRDGNGNERWAWGRLENMPTIRITVVNRIHAPMFLSFQRMSDWHGVTVTKDVTTVAALST